MAPHIPLLAGLVTLMGALAEIPANDAGRMRGSLDIQHLKEVEATSMAETIHRWAEAKAVDPHSNSRFLLAVRHGQSEHNLWEEMQGLRIQTGGPSLLFSTPDASLTSVGQAQCKLCRELLALVIAKLRGLEEEDRLTKGTTSTFCIDAFVSSPNSRAFQTATIAFEGLMPQLSCHPNEPLSWLLAPHLRERTHNIADVGLPHVVLAEKAKWLRRNGKLGSCPLDYTLIEEDDEWFIPQERPQVASNIEEYLNSPIFPKQSKLREILKFPVFVKGYVPASKSDRLRYYKNAFAYARYSDHVPMELSWMVNARRDAFVRAVCSVPDLRSLVVVAHFNLLMALTGYSGFRNAEARLFEVNCDTLEVLSLGQDDDNE